MVVSTGILDSLYFGSEIFPVVYSFQGEYFPPIAALSIVSYGCPANQPRVLTSERPL